MTMNKINVKIGSRYKQLTVVEYIDRPENPKRYSNIASSNWIRCKCDCGNYIEVPAYIFGQGYVGSCGCFKANRGIELKKSGKLKKKGIILTYGGQSYNIKDWSRITNIPYYTIIDRRRRGLPLEKVFKEYIANES